MNESKQEQPHITKRQKTVLVVLSLIALCLIVSSVLIFWVLPNVLRSRFRLDYVELIQQYSAEYDLEPSLVAAVIYTESSFRPDATSRVGARGLMQIMPDTGREIAEALGEPFDEDVLYQPEVSNAADTRTPRQKRALLRLLKKLKAAHPDARILGHRDLPDVHKDCPCFDAIAEYSSL